MMIMNIITVTTYQQQRAIIKLKPFTTVYYLQVFIMSAPRQPASQPLYLGAGEQYGGQSSSPLATFWREQVMAPENRAGNLK